MCPVNASPSRSPAPFLIALLLTLFVLLASLAVCNAHAGALTDYAENKLIDYLFRGQASGTPSTWYVALYTTCPTDASAGTEVANANGYARQTATANALTVWAATQGGTSASSGSSGTTSNLAAITFATATGSWGTINCYGLVDSGTYGGGALWVYSAITSPPTITSGMTPSFAAGALTVQIDN